MSVCHTSTREKAYIIKLISIFVSCLSETEAGPWCCRHAVFSASPSVNRLSEDPSVMSIVFVYEAVWWMTYISVFRAWEHFFFFYVFWQKWISAAEVVVWLMYDVYWSRTLVMTEETIVLYYLLEGKKRKNYSRLTFLTTKPTMKTSYKIVFLSVSAR